MAMLHTQRHLRVATGSSTHFSSFEPSKVACQRGIGREKENVTGISRTVLGTDAVPVVTYSLDVTPNLYCHIRLNIGFILW